ncbi:MurR/RpiR family transcriptional regulator [Deinococcus yavapaiensis]|uniref:RpiR family transcriptional regulator n=1 Tax=Deinococcus yavapaiensis KR-236 TaxID=694435 RepID=A0A318SHM9_9DEIO|nr:MurR/RpiR family transcriptional regulator [Deinococcus yavapaiensis]PYE53476.1 RpiR family transcriptional regulator [Deinococcus yavapaiensis KR-236]
MLTELLAERLADLTPAERRVADHLQRRADELPMLSAAAIARDSGVNPSSVTRLAQKLGFQGYPDFQQAVRLHLRARHSPTTLPTQSLAQAHWAQEHRAIDMLAQLPEAHIDDAVTLLHDARRVLVTGARASTPAASYATHLWRSVRADVHLLGGDAPGLPELWFDVGPPDLLVAFTVRRYARSTATLIHAAERRGVPLLLVTDSLAAPGARTARRLLLASAPVEESKFVPLAAPASLVMLLASKLLERTGDERLHAIDAALADTEALTY